MSFSGWNYRVVRELAPTTEDNPEEIFQIYEIYYAEDGATIAAYSTYDSTAAESLDDLRGDIEYLLAALDQPIVEVTDLPGDES